MNYNLRKIKLLVWTILLSFSMCLQGCSVPHSIDTSISEQEEQELSDSQNESGPETARNYTDPVEAAFHEFSWTGFDNKSLSDRSARAFSLTVADLDLDGETEFIITTNTLYLRERNLSEVFKFDGGKIISIGTFENTGLIPWVDYNGQTNFEYPYLIIGMQHSWTNRTMPYYHSQEGLPVMLLNNIMIDSGQYDFELFVEVSLKAFTTTPILCHVIPDHQSQQYGETPYYYYFDAQNYIYDTSHEWMPRPDELPDKGFIEITEEEFGERMDGYMSTLEYIGDLELDHIGGYESIPSNFTAPSERDLSALEKTNERLKPFGIILDLDDTNEDMCEKYQHAIANTSYQAYISALPESTDSTDDAIAQDLQHVKFSYRQYYSDKPYNFERTYTLSGSSLDIEITSLIYIGGKNEEIVTTEGKLTERQWQDFFALESTQAAFHGTSRYPNPELEYEPEGWLTVGGNRYYDPHLENSPDYLNEIVNEIEKMAEEVGVAERHGLAIEAIIG